jgi:TyrR family helix-turn-helix protein/PAS domain S-box-containing protein
LLSEYIFQNPFVGITVTDAEGICLQFNEAQTRITGIPKEVLIGRDLKKAVKEEIFSASSTIEVLKTKQEVYLHQVSASGHSYDVKGQPIFDGNGNLIYTISYLVDVSEPIRFQKYVREQELKRERLQDQIPRILREANIVDGLVVNSPRMRDIIDLIRKVSVSDATVLLTGPSGSGKEMIANLIHQQSNRRAKPFIKLNCAAIPENLLESELFGYVPGAFTGGDRRGKRGIFEAADKGSLLLDEIGEMPLSLQSKLLRVLQENEVKHIGSETPVHVDVRIIAATNASLTRMMMEKRFREDLYYRLNVIHIDIPGLDERREDIPALAAWFIDRLNQKYSTSKIIRGDVIRFLSGRQYPGNIRELQNLMERLYLQSGPDEITLNEAFEAFFNRRIPNEEITSYKLDDMQDKSLKEIVGDYEKEVLKRYLDTYGKADDVAQKLKIDRSTISRKLKRYEL